MRKPVILLLGVLLLFSGIACSSSEQPTPPASSSEPSASDSSQSYESQTNTSQEDKTEASQSQSTQNDSTVEKNPIVTIEMAGGQKIKVELYPDMAPNTVNNFISLVNKGFYNGLIFHRVIPGFMIQGGDPQGTGIGGPGYSIKGEFAANGFTNNLKHERGVISMARSGMPDSAGSQFFIMVNSASSLDGDYAAFGKVLEGLETADAIVNTDRDADDKPLKEQKMQKVTVETFGVKYEEPVKLQE